MIIPKSHPAEVSCPNTDCINYGRISDCYLNGCKGVYHAKSITIPAILLHQSQNGSLETKCERIER